MNNKITIKIDGMSCEHCSNRIENMLKKIENIKEVSVNLKNKEVIINGESIDINKIKEKIEDLGYSVVDIIEW